MIKLPLTVLVSEGPTARMYLEVMHRAGYAPANIVLMVWKRLPGTNTDIGTWIPFSRLRQVYNRNVQEQRMMFWPRTIRQRHPGICRSVTAGLQSVHSDADDIIATIVKPADWTRYTDEIHTVSLKQFRDTAFVKTLADISCENLLFTGGGLVPAELLVDRPYRVFHVHPAILPHIRGADGLLWSWLINKKAGASCFIMEPGLDEGDIVMRREFDLPEFLVPRNEIFDAQMLYRVLFSFVDPLLRAITFTDLLKNSSGLKNLPPSDSQNIHDGETYHFLHPDLQQLALSLLFKNAESYEDAF